MTVQSEKKAPKPEVAPKSDETPKADKPSGNDPVAIINNFVSTGKDTYISTFWPMIQESLKGLEATSSDLEKYTPPTNAELAEFIKSPDGQADAVIAEATKEIARLEKVLAELRTTQYSKAGDILQPQTISAEDLDSLRKQFTDSKEAANTQLTAIKIYVKTMVQGEEGERLHSALDSVKLPRAPYRLGAVNSSTTPVANPEIAAFKAWADANNVSYPSRGRVPQEKIDMWKAAVNK